MQTHMGLLAPPVPVASVKLPTQRFDSVKVSHIKASFEFSEAVERVGEDSATRETWPAMFLPKSNVTDEEDEIVAELLVWSRRAPAFSTVPLTWYTATGRTVREAGARIYSLYGTECTDWMRRERIRLTSCIVNAVD